MSRRAATFSQADIARALRAAEQVAAGRYAIEIAHDGTIRLMPVSGPLEPARAQADEEALGKVPAFVP